MFFLCKAFRETFFKNLYLVPFLDKNTHYIVYILLYTRAHVRMCMPVTNFSLEIKNFWGFELLNDFYWKNSCF